MFELDFNSTKINSKIKLRVKIINHSFNFIGKKNPSIFHHDFEIKINFRKYPNTLISMHESKLGDALANILKK